MKRLMFIVAILFLVSFTAAQTQVEYFHGIGCPHCANVEASGVLEKLALEKNISFVQYEVYYDVKGQQVFKQLQDYLNLPNDKRGIPFMFINCSGEYTYLAGDEPIIQNAERYAETCTFGDNIQKESFWTKIKNYVQESFYNNGGSEGKLTFKGWIFFILAALIDSVNPCAFGVLIFLMISLLKTGSAKRALKYGLVYSFFVFLTYFLAGLGIFKAIQSLSVVSRIVYGVLGFFVLIMALLEFYDYFQTKKGKKSILKIPTSAKPIIEKVMTNGTLPTIILAGILVSLFELPCTGGIYLAILTSMAQSQSFSIFYLFLYNLIFILPLVIITWIVYKGESTEFLHDWTNKNKKWMKLLAGIILVLLAWYILSKARLF